MVTILNGLLVNSYYICKRKCWLSYHKINLTSSSEDILIGKELHENLKAKNKEILIDNIKLDQLTDNYIIEAKKGKTFVKAAEMQLKYYMYILNQKGIKKDGKIIFIEDGSAIKIIFDDNLIKEIEEMIVEISSFLENNKIPNMTEQIYCKKCAYYEYCYV